MCNDNGNTGLRRCPKKMFSSGGPTLKKNKKKSVATNYICKV